MSSGGGARDSSYTPRISLGEQTRKKITPPSEYDSVKYPNAQKGGIVVKAGGGVGSVQGGYAPDPSYYKPKETTPEAPIKTQTTIQSPVSQAQLNYLKQQTKTPQQQVLIQTQQQKYAEYERRLAQASREKGRTVTSKEAKGIYKDVFSKKTSSVSGGKALSKPEEAKQYIKDIKSGKIKGKPIDKTDPFYASETFLDVTRGAKPKKIDTGFKLPFQEKVFKLLSVIGQTIKKSAPTSEEYLDLLKVPKESKFRQGDTELKFRGVKAGFSILASVGASVGSAQIKSPTETRFMAELSQTKGQGKELSIFAETKGKGQTTYGVSKGILFDLSDNVDDVQVGVSKGYAITGGKTQVSEHLRPGHYIEVYDTSTKETIQTLNLDTEQIMDVKQSITAQGFHSAGVGEVYGKASKTAEGIVYRGDASGVVSGSGTAFKGEITRTDLIGGFKEISPNLYGFEGGTPDFAMIKKGASGISFGTKPSISGIVITPQQTTTAINFAPNPSGLTLSKSLQTQISSQVAGLVGATSQGFTQPSLSLGSSVSLVSALGTQKTPSVKTSSPHKSESSYAGTGQYEKTIGGSVPRQNERSLVYTPSVSVSEVRTIERPTYKILSGFSHKEETRLKTNLTAVSGQAQGEKLKTIQKEVSVTSKTTPGFQGFLFTQSTPKTKIPPIIKTPPSTQKTSRKAGGTYQVFERRFGKFKPIAITSTYGKALKIGTEKVSRGLGATFKIKGGKVGAIPRGFYGKKTKSGLEIIEKPSLRLSHRQEKLEIGSYKRRKKKKWGLL